MDNNKVDKKLAYLMTYIEHKYKLPVLACYLDDWISENPEVNKVIYDIYLKISDERDL